MSIEALSGKVFLLVTGASRGIGRQIAISFAKHLQDGSHVLLLATNLNCLTETAKNISSKIVVDTTSVDLSKPTKEEFHEIIEKALKTKKAQDFDRVVIVHNAGTVGDITKCVNEMTDPTIWRDYYNLNVFSPAILNGVMMNVFKDVKNKVVINITSLFAFKAGKNTGYYCTGKAAREMFFKVFALENSDVNVLSYSPGPVETDMFNKMCEDMSDKESRDRFISMRNSKTYLTTEQTVDKLLTVLKEHKYKSGDRVDYYDKL